MSTQPDSQSTKSPITYEATNLAWLEVAVLGAETSALLAARIDHEHLVKAINALTNAAKAFGYALAKTEGK